MYGEAVLCDYLSGTGIALFSVVALYEVSRSPRQGFPRCALVALFLLVVGGCAGSLTDVSEDGPLQMIRSVMNLQDISHPRSIALLAILLIIVYLLVAKTVPRQRPRRMLSMFSLVVGIWFLVVIIIRSVQMGQMTMRGTTLAGISLAVHSFALGCAIFALMRYLGADSAADRSWCASCVTIAWTMQTAAFTLFGISFALQLATGGADISPAMMSPVATAWSMLIAGGIGGMALVVFNWRHRGGHGFRSGTSAKTLLAGICCSAVAGVALFAIIALSQQWTA